MSDDKKNEQSKPIEDEKLDQVSGGVIVERSRTLIPGGQGPPPITPPKTPVHIPEPL
jgi:hypothetical protein